jgi:hypothetical protein
LTPAVFKAGVKDPPNDDNHSTTRQSRLTDEEKVSTDTSVSERRH